MYVGILWWRLLRMTVRERSTVLCMQSAWMRSIAEGSSLSVCVLCATSSKQVFNLNEKLISCHMGYYFFKRPGTIYICSPNRRINDKKFIYLFMYNLIVFHLSTLNIVKHCMKFLYFYTTNLVVHWSCAVVVFSVVLVLVLVALLRSLLSLLLLLGLLGLLSLLLHRRQQWIQI